jgi:hypothetical protein
VTADAPRDADFIAGRRIAELEELRAGVYLLRVELLDEEGARVDGRPVQVTVERQRLATVVVPRGCGGLTCRPCLGNRCVDPACTEETPEACGEPACAVDADCPGGAACATARCVAGACLLEPDGATCGDGEYCDPDRGCRPLQGAADRDGGVPSDGGVSSGPPSHGWTRAFGDGAHQQAGAIAIDSMDRLYVTGALEGTADFGGGPLTATGLTDLFVASFEADGAHRWSVRFGGTDPADDRISGHAIAVSSDGRVHVLGELRGSATVAGSAYTSLGGSDLILVTFDAGGNALRSVRYGSDRNDIGGALAPDGRGGLCITGGTVGSLDLGGGALADSATNRADVFAGCFDTDGAHRWSAGYTVAGLEHVGRGIAAGSGTLRFAGALTGGSADFGGGPLESDVQHAFLASLDLDGTHRWSQAHASAEAVDVAVGPDGTAWVVGSFERSVDFGGGPLEPELLGPDVFLAAFDSDGAHRFSERFGTRERDDAEAVALGPGGAVAYALASERDDGPVLLAAATVADGVLWSQRYGTAGAGVDRVTDLAVDSRGRIYLVGGLSMQGDFGDAIAEAGGGDALIVQLVP